MPVQLLLGFARYVQGEIWMPGFLCYFHPELLSHLFPSPCHGVTVSCYLEAEQWQLEAEHWGYV